MRIKICGITNKEDALNAVSLGADALGFIFYDKSPRAVQPDTVEEIVMNLPPFITLVGVFVNETKETIQEISRQCKLNLVQLHGDEPPSFCQSIEKRVVKAIKVKEDSDIQQIRVYQGSVSSILLDTKVDQQEGGTGISFDWGLALKAKEYDIPIILAGGINFTNIEKAIQLVNPYGLDISSGVEVSPGKKEYSKLQDIFKIARKY